MDVCCLFSICADGITFMAVTSELSWLVIIWPELKAFGSIGAHKAVII